MRCTTKFKPSVDGLESREVLSTMSFAPHFIRVGHAAPVLAGPGYFTPLYAMQPPVGSHFPGQGGTPVAGLPRYLLFGHPSNVQAIPGLIAPLNFMQAPVGSRFPGRGGMPVAGLPPFLLFGHPSNVR